VSAYRESYSTRIAAPLDACFAVLCAFDEYPRWSSPILSCRVLDRHPDGMPKRVEFALDMTIKTVRYVLEYVWDLPRGVTWTMVEGDLASVEGSYRFEESAGTTTATCTQAIDLGFWLPGFLRSTIEAKALRDSVEEFRAAVEGGGAKAGSRS
jgi:uncharacterized membrane protein